MALHGLVEDDDSLLENNTDLTANGKFDKLKTSMR